MKHCSIVIFNLLTARWWWGWFCDVDTGLQCSYRHSFLRRWRGYIISTFSCSRAVGGFQLSTVDCVTAVYSLLSSFTGRVATVFRSVDLLISTRHLSARNSAARQQQTPRQSFQNRCLRSMFDDLFSSQAWRSRLVRRISHWRTYVHRVHCSITNCSVTIVRVQWRIWLDALRVVRRPNNICKHKFQHNTVTCLLCSLPHHPVHILNTPISRTSIPGASRMSAAELMYNWVTLHYTCSPTEQWVAPPDAHWCWVSFKTETKNCVLERGAEPKLQFFGNFHCN